MYRTEHGVKSFILDDDNCDCYTTLNAGHAMCYAGFSANYGTEHEYGVGLLNENGCSPSNGPSSDNSLFLFYAGMYSIDLFECCLRLYSSKYRRLVNSMSWGLAYFFFNYSLSSRFCYAVLSVPGL